METSSIVQIIRNIAEPIMIVLFLLVLAIVVWKVIYPLVKNK